MKSNLFVATILVGMMSFSCIGLGQATKPVVLNGLDPVLLVQGKRVKGKATLSSVFGKFKYLFSSPADRAAFAAAPAKYAVQLDGACLMGGTMDGDPGLFLVYDGKIYLAGADLCLEAVKKDPRAFIKAASKLSPTRTVAILMFGGVEDIDFAGPLEVFGEAGYRVITVAERPGPLKTTMNLKVIPDYTFSDAPHFDVLLLPGGAVPTLDRTAPTMKWIAKVAKETPYVMSVCNGAFWLARAGLLDGKEATTISGRIGQLQTGFPKIHVVCDKRVVDNGNILTTAGLSAGIDGAFHLVAKLDGYEAAHSIALGMEYNWQPNSTYARGNDADKYLSWVRRVNLPDETKYRILQQDGNADHWQATYEVVNGKLTADGILKAIEPAVLASQWRQVASTDDKITWEFTGQDGKPWRGIESIETDAKAPGRFVVSLSVQRA